MVLDVILAVGHATHDLLKALVVVLFIFVVPFVKVHLHANFVPRVRLSTLPLLFHKLKVQPWLKPLMYPLDTSHLLIRKSHFHLLLTITTVLVVDAIITMRHLASYLYWLQIWLQQLMQFFWEASSSSLD